MLSFEHLMVFYEDFLFYINNIITTIDWIPGTEAVIILCFGLYALHKICEKYLWKDIGVLEEIYTYEFFNGKPQFQPSISTSTTGTGPSLENDRRYLVYTPRNERKQQNDIVLDKTQFYTLIPPLVRSQTDLWLNSRRDKVFFPDGSYLFAYDCGDEYAQYLTNAYGAGVTQYRLGLQTNYDKILSRDHYRYSKVNTKINKSLNPRHAECILVNKTSVLTMGEEVQSDNFRPNLVVNMPLYMEDKIKTLRIGNAVFSSPLPCIFDKTVNYNLRYRAMSYDNQPYSNLQRTRKLKDIFPTFSNYSWMSAFGINFIVSKDGQCTVNDRVYAKF